MISKERFSLNRIICPSLSVADFLGIAGQTGIKHIELRNDLEDTRITGNLPPKELNAMCRDKGIVIETINAVQKFNLPSSFRKAEDEIKKMADICGQINCKSIILCPNNDKQDKRSAEEFISDTAEALILYAPVFREAGITGLVEPLGFGECSIRGKKAAIEAISRSGCSDLYMVVHDTFHHYLGTDSDYYPAQTGLIHISGVEANIPDQEMRDCHRVLVTAKDRIGNKKQINDLESKGYRGIISFEPFSGDIQKLDKKTLSDEISASVRFIINQA